MLLTTEQPNLGSSDRVQWVSFSCGNDTDQPKRLVVELDNIFFDEASFYVFENRQVGPKIEHINWHTAPQNRPVPSRYYAFPLDLKPRQTVRVFVKMQFKGGIFVCPVTVWARDYYQQQQQFYSLVFLIPVAVLAILTLISLLFWLTYQKPILFYYALYTSGILGFILNIEGFLVSSANLSLAGPKGWILCTSLAWIGNLLFTNQYVFAPYTLPFSRLRRYCFRAVFGFLLIFFVIALLVPTNGLLAFTSICITVLTPLFIFCWLLVGLRYRLTEARIYAVAIIPVMVSGFLIAAGGESFLPIGDKLYVLLYYAPPVEAIILGFGVARQFFREREQLMLIVQTSQTQLINSQETEQQRIAQDLHDDLGGTLATIRQRLANIRQQTTDPDTQRAFDDLEPLIEKSGQDLRRIAHNLMPPDFERLGLVASAGQLVRAIAPRPTRFEFVTSGTVQKLPVTVELNIYRIISELVQNIQKHARANRASVQLLYDQNQLTVLVEDDGMGIPSQKLANGTGIGLKNAMLRANYIGATMQRETGEGGTFVVITLPYHSPDYASRAPDSPYVAPR